MLQIWQMCLRVGTSNLEKELYFNETYYFLNR